MYKAVPLAADNLEVDRVTIGFVTKFKEKFIYQDRWTDPVRDHKRGQWTGWTFFKVKKRDGLSARSDLGAPHDRGALQPGGSELPRAEGAHRILLARLQGLEDLRSPVLLYWLPSAPAPHEAKPVPGQLLRLTLPLGPLPSSAIPHGPQLPQFPLRASLSSPQYIVCELPAWPVWPS